MYTHLSIFFIIFSSLGLSPLSGAGDLAVLGDVLVFAELNVEGIVSRLS